MTNPDSTEARLILTDFLLARIAEDEAAASEHGHDAGEVYVREIGMTRLRYVTRPAKARVLADCAARRGLVDACLEAIEMNRPPSATNSEVVWLAEDFLKALAVPHADHPDYCVEWKP